MAIPGDWAKDEQNRITFVMADAAGNEVAGIGDGNLTIEISKSGGAFVASAGTNTEIGDGWYTYLATANEADTVGTVSVKVDGAGAVQQNLEYVVQSRIWARNQQNRITFVMIDALGNEVTGIGDGNLTVEISKNGGAFAVGGGADTEIGDGWYAYLSSTGDADTVGTVSVKVTGAGAIQQNLEYIVSQRAIITSFGLGYAQPIPKTLLPIGRYAEIMQIPLPHFWQLAGVKAPIVSGCADPIWDQTARELLAWSILQAEQMIAEYLNFWPSPKFLTDEEIAFSLPGLRYDWRNGEVETRWKYIDCFGTETLTLLQSDVNVSYADLDGDPNQREETATVIVNDDTCITPCNVIMFFRVADGAEDTADPRWEIRPLKVDIDSGVITIRGEASQFVKPALWSVTKLDAAGSVDTDAWIITYDTSNFVTAVDVYCRTINEATPITLQWNGICSCPGICQHSTQTACAYRTDKRRGYFAPIPATWNGTTNVKATALRRDIQPESVLANYRAGYPIDTRSCRMNANMERAIVKLTNALLPEPPCGFCGVAETIWEEDRKDIDPLTPEAASMPWDIYKRGALDAWRIIKLFAMGVGGKVGRGYR
jgi:hypothetical protein